MVVGMAMVEEAAAVCPNSSAAAAAAVRGISSGPTAGSGISVERSAPPFTGKFTGQQDSQGMQSSITAQFACYPASDSDIPQAGRLCVTRQVHAEAIIAAAVLRATLMARRPMVLRMAHLLTSSSSVRIRSWRA